MKRRALCLIVGIAGILMGIPAFAQLNESDTARFQFRIGASGTWQKGNVTILAHRSRLELVTNSHKPLVLKTQNNSLYQEFGNQKADNDINSRTYLYWKPTQKVYPFAMAYFQVNYRRFINTRGFGGIGATWQFVQKPATNMKLSGSLVYESTTFRSNQFNENFYNGNNSIALWRVTLYVAGWHQLFHKRLILFYNTYVQPGFDQVANNRFQVDVGIDYLVWRGLNILVQYNFSYEQVVVSNVQQQDRILTYGLSYQFKKKMLSK